MRLAAPIDEMIGAARDPGGLGGGPIAQELRVRGVAALGRLDKGEGDARVLDRLPIDIALIFGNIHAMNVILGAAGRGIVMQIGLRHRIGQEIRVFFRVRQRRAGRESRRALAVGGVEPPAATGQKGEEEKQRGRHGANACGES